jgi:hypothetical protein
MSQPVTRSLDELVPDIEADRRNPFTNGVRHPAQPVVLESVDRGQTFGERPVSLLCPGCADVLTQYRNGLPRWVARVQEVCEACETTLERWSVLAIGTAYERAPTKAECREVVTDYWEQNLWSGIMTGETSPRTREYSRLYSEQADAFGWAWDVTCPLCRRPLDDLEFGLEYHHWSRDPDKGVCLCRQCHDALSGQECDTDLDWEAQVMGLRNKHDLQITRLALREQAIEPCEALAPLVNQLCGRYNLAQPSAQVYSLLSQTLTDPEVLEQVSDGFLLAGLDRTIGEESLSL